MPPPRGTSAWLFLTPQTVCAHLHFLSVSCADFRSRCMCAMYTEQCIPSSLVLPQSPSLDGPVQLTPPPYGLSALEPHMSRDTLDTH
eukprot:scaffold16710_cov17-Tisochrysis_lutea.AAC.5